MYYFPQTDNNNDVILTCDLEMTLTIPPYKYRMKKGTDVLFFCTHYTYSSSKTTFHLLNFSANPTV